MANKANYAAKKEATYGSVYRYTNSGVMSANGTLTLQAPANKTFSTSSPPKYQNFVKILGQLEAAAGIALGAINSGLVLGASSKSVGCGVTSGVISLAPVAALALYNVIAQFLITRNATKAKNSGDSARGMDADIIVIATKNAEFDSKLGIDINSENPINPTEFSELNLDNNTADGGSVFIEASNKVSVKVQNAEINIDNNQIEIKNADKTITVNQDSIEFKQSTGTIKLTDSACEFTDVFQTRIKSDKVTMGTVTFTKGKLKFGP
jgi:peroxiredoxin